MVRMALNEINSELTEEERRDLEAAESRQPVFDEDSPALTPKAAEGFRSAARERNRRRRERETV